MTPIRHEPIVGRWTLGWILMITAICYWPGLKGGWLFDDYPNIVDNRGVQPDSGSFRSLVGAALSSPASELKRPLASLSFAANYLTGGLDPYWMKLTNLFIHLLNGVLVYLLTRALYRTSPLLQEEKKDEWLAAWVTTGWLLLPINLTAVLYVVQRMESMANLFVLLGLLGYVVSRERMLTGNPTWGNLCRCTASIVVPTAMGMLAKETAIMLPLYALLTEWMLFGFRCSASGRVDNRLVTAFFFLLVLPMMVGLAWILPSLLRPEAWATRDFNICTRMLTETRVVLDYIGWTVLPLPRSLSFYHDDYPISNGLLSSWTTAVSLCALLALLGGMLWLRKRHPIAALGIALFFGAQLLTGTILPLELVYEHRNYFASFGLLLTLSTLLNLRTSRGFNWTHPVGRLVLYALLLWWTGMTVTSAYAWGDPLRLARTLAERNPQSPRALYELGRTYIIYSRNNPASPYTRLAYAPLEQAATLPGSSILPLQALIFMNSRMGLPIENTWWESMNAKLAARRPGVQDESSLAALAQCAESKQCQLPSDHMRSAFEAAMIHSNPSPRLLSTYAGYAWSVMNEHPLGLSLQTQAVDGAPREPAYLVTLIRMLLSQGDSEETHRRLQQLEQLNVGGHLDAQISTLRAQIKAADSLLQGNRPA